jgi:uncharacterized damage-inducible protein DinB
MDVLESLRRQAHNNAWANYRLHRAIAELDAEAYRATRTSFFPSIHLTLVHILYVDLLYLDALEAGGRGRTLFPEMERAEREATFEQVRAAQAAADRRLSTFVEAMTDAAALDLPVHIERADHVQVESRGDVLLHLYEHQIHHRGQAHAMLAGTAVAPPQLDEFFLAEELPLRRAELEALGLPIR